MGTSYGIDTPMQLKPETGTMSSICRALRQRLAEAADRASLIIEGIYGSILKQIFLRVATFIRRNIADDECVSNLM
jgi:hypothetical protein